MRQSGNVLFLILLAVALFAALSYALTQSNRSGGKNISDEQLELQVAELLNYLTSLDLAIERMTISGLIKDTQVAFDTPAGINLRTDGGSLNYSNSDCTSNDCKVFAVSGGSMPFITFEEMTETPPNWGATWSRPGHHIYQVINVVNVGSAANDIAVRIPAIKFDLCKAINIEMGLPEIPTLDVSGESSVSYAGSGSSLVAHASPYTFGDNDTDFLGHRTFCIRLVDGTFEYGDLYHVLIPR